MRLLSNCKLLLCGIITVSCWEVSAQDWPQWRGDQSNGKVNSKEPLVLNSQLRQEWHTQLGSGYSNVSVVGNQVIAISSDGTDDFVISLNLDSGEELWRAKVGATFQGMQGSEDGPSSSPCIIDETVIAFGPNGDLVAFKLADGKELWRNNLSETMEAATPWYGFGSSPVRCGQAAFLPISTGDGTSGILFDPTDGSVIWKSKGNTVDYQGGYWIEDRNELVIVDSNKLAVIDAQTGTERFQTIHSQRGDLAYPQATPVSDTQVLLTFEKKAALYEIDWDNQKFKQLWSSRELRDSYSPPVCHRDAIFGMCGTFLVCVDLQTGKRLWKSREPGTRGISLVNDSLVMLSSDGEIVCAAADPQGYQETARVKVADRGGYTAPVFANNRIVIRNTSAVACAAVSSAANSDTTITTETSSSTSDSSFGRFLSKLEKSTDQQKMVDQWWSEQTSFPLIENNSIVHFVFRGDAEDVALLGDMTEDRHVAETMKRVGTSNLFYRSYQYMPEGVWHYAFLVDYDQVVCDPMNDLKVPALIDMGGNPRSTGYEDHKEESVLLMPGSRQAEYLVEKSDRPAGEIKTIEFTSRFRWIQKKPLKIYLPASYAADQNAKFPVIYLLGGEEWLSHAGAKTAFDNLMGEKCEQAIVVFVPYHDGSGDRIGGAGLSRLVLNDIVPAVEEKFRTRAPAISVGAADDATAAIHLASMSPDRFSGLVVYSPYMDEPDFQSLESLQDFPARCFLDWSRYEPRVLDENTDNYVAAKKLQTFIESKGCEMRGEEVAMGPGWKSWILRIDHALEFVLPVENSK